MTSKEYFFDRVLEEVTSGDTSKSLRILELGCGTAKYVPTLMKKYPQLTYIGIEPIQTSFVKAQENLRDIPNTQVVYQLGYGQIAGIEKESFDVVISFSVLEHVKQLDKFLSLGEQYLKKGGLMVHRYDLGHSLYPGSIKEQFQVFLGNMVPAVLPERTFVRYVPEPEVVQYYKELLGSEPYKYTYHQMPNHKRLAKTFDEVRYSGALMQDVFAWEFAHADTFRLIPTRTREKLFPTVAIWGKKS